MKQHDAPVAVGVWRSSPRDVWPSLVQVFAAAIGKAYTCFDAFLLAPSIAVNSSATTRKVIKWGS